MVANDFMGLRIKQVKPRSLVPPFFFNLIIKPAKGPVYVVVPSESKSLSLRACMASLSFHALLNTGQCVFSLIIHVCTCEQFLTETITLSHLIMIPLRGNFFFQGHAFKIEE